MSTAARPEIPRALERRTRPRAAFLCIGPHCMETWPSETRLSSIKKQLPSPGGSSQGMERKQVLIIILPELTRESEAFGVYGRVGI